MSKGTYSDFFDTLGFRESSNRYDVVNIYGSLGRYQMGEAAFTDIGLYTPDANPYDNVYGGTFSGKYGVWSVADFLATPAAQDQAIRDYMALQFGYLKSVWAYDGQTINGVAVTTSGMLAAAHILGWDGAAAWLNSGGDSVPADNFGTTIVEYATLMGGYDTPFTINHDVAETIAGGSGSDTLYGRGGNDTLSGKGGTDTLVGGIGDDTIDGGAGTDTAVYDASFSSFTITYNAVTGAYTLTSVATGTDIVTGVEKFQFSDQTVDAANLLGAPPAANPTASISADTSSAAEGNSGSKAFTFTVTLSEASATAQTLSWAAAGWGASAADQSDFASSLSGSLSFAAGETSKTITILVAGDTSFEANEGFTVTLSDLSSGLTAGKLSASATIANDDVQTVFTGDAGANTLSGGGSNDTISGMGGNDSLSGNGGDDTIAGGTGDDTIDGGTGNDTIDGGAGTDTAVYDASFSSFTISYNAVTGAYTLTSLATGTDIVTGVEKFQFSDQTVDAANLLGAPPAPNPTASISADSSSANEGNSGSKTFTFTVTLSEASATTQTLSWAAAGSGANAADQADFASSLSGNLSFAAGETSKTITLLVAGDSSFEANEGFTVTLSELSSGLTAGTLTASATIANDDVQTVFTGDAGANTLSGGGSNDTISGMGGNDSLSGNGGDDTINGGTGDDTIDGGTGTDTAVYDASFSSFTISYNAVAGAYTLTSLATGTDIVTGVEKFQFSDQTVNAANLLVAASVSADSSSATEGNSGSKAFTFTVTLSAASAAAQTLSWAAAGSGANAADQADFASNLSGNLSFAAGETSKTITLLVAGDSSFEANEGFTVTLSNLSSGLTAGTLSASATIVNDDIQTVFTGDAGANTLSGAGGNDTVSGLAGNDILYGNAGADWLDGGTGNDTMYGGLGDDTYVVDSTLDVVSELNGGGTDTVRTTLSSFTLGTDIEALVYFGSSAFSGTGNALANTITGGIGNDILNGAGGADRLIGGLGNDTFIFDAIGDVAVEAVGEGTDIVQSGVSVSGLLSDAATAAMIGDNVDNILLTGSSAINATGNALANIITGNSANNVLNGGGGADTLDGGAGNDTLSGGDGDDVLLGGAGNDSYSGGTGNDTVSFASATSAITFSLAVSGGQSTGGAGTDTLVSGHSIENLIGGAGADKLTGDANANRIDGGAGSDIITGGLGNDVLIGGSGADYFVFNTSLGSTNIDVISGYNVADDTIRLENSGIFSALKSTGKLAAGAFVTGTKALQSDDRIIYDPSTGALYYDPDGSGSAAMIQFATLTNVTGTLTYADFVII
jgi:Ca2+-binding RTX toxin-like protein